MCNLSWSFQSFHSVKFHILSEHCFGFRFDLLWSSTSGSGCSVKAENESHTVSLKNPPAPMKKNPQRNRMSPWPLLTLQVLQTTLEGPAHGSVHEISQQPVTIGVFGEVDHLHPFLRRAYPVLFNKTRSQKVLENAPETATRRTGRGGSTL